MNLSLSTGFLRPRTVEEVVDVCRASGTTSLEFWGQDGLFTETNDYAKLSNRLRSSGLTVGSVHAPFTTDSSIDDTCYGEYLNRFSTTCNAAAEVGAHRLVVHPLSWRGETPKGRGAIRDTMPRSFAFWEHVVRTAASYGLATALENLPASVAWPGGCHIGLVKRIVEELDLDGVGICIDLSHCMANGESPLSLRDSPDVEIGVIHVSDGIQGMDRHLPPGEGDHDWSLLRNELFVPNPNAALVLEVRSPYLSGFLVGEMCCFLDGNDRDV